jgi:hypothetical protein
MKILLCTLLISLGLQAQNNDPRYYELNRLANQLKREARQNYPSMEEIKRAETLVKKAIRVVRGELTGPVTPPPAPVYSSMKLYTSSDCSSGLLANVRDNMSCTDIPTNNYVYSMKIDNSCYKIAGVRAQSACSNLRRLTNPVSAIKIYTSNNCTTGLQSAFDEATNCQNLNSNYVYSAKINGTCHKLAGARGPSVCNNIKNALVPGEKLNIYTSNNCSSGLSAVLSRQSVCSELQNNNYVYSIKPTGSVCEKISGTHLINACNAFAP